MLCTAAFYFVFPDRIFSVNFFPNSLLAKDGATYWYFITVASSATQQGEPAPTPPPKSPFKIRTQLFRTGKIFSPKYYQEKYWVGAFKVILVFFSGETWEYAHKLGQNISCMSLWKTNHLVILKIFQCVKEEINLNSISWSSLLLQKLLSTLLHSLI